MKKRVKIAVPSDSEEDKREQSFKVYKRIQEQKMAALQKRKRSLIEEQESSSQSDDH